jgi:biopolymer transport protein ExbB
MLWIAAVAGVLLAGVAARAPSYGAPPDAPAPAASEVGEEAAEASTGDSMSWEWIVQSGGWLMYVLGGLSVLTVTLVIYFFVVLRNNQVTPRNLHRELIQRIRSGAIEEARKTCEYYPCPLSAVALAAIDHTRNIPEENASLLKDVMEGEGSRQSESLQGQTQYLLDIAVVSPMIGLLGTVFGMLRAFSSVALDVAKAKPVVLAEGVSQALVTTAFGLIVGIPAMMFYAYFRRKVSRQVSVLEAASADILTALLSRQSGLESPAGDAMGTLLSEESR